MSSDHATRSPDPDYEEIRKLTLEIQEGWSERERRKRAGLQERGAPASVPMCRVSDLKAAVKESK